MSEPRLTCPSCGVPVEAGHNFCPKCGTGIPENSPAAALPATEKASVPVWAIAVGALVLCTGMGLVMAGAYRMMSGESAPASARVTERIPQPEGAFPRETPDGDTVVDSAGKEHLLAGVFRCRKGAEFDVDPEDAVVAVDEVVIGKADDFDGKGGGRTYYFRGPGTHFARFSLKGYSTAWVKIIVSPDAPESVVSVDTELRER